MTNVEVWKLCLDDRKTEYEQLKSELEQIEIKFLKAEFEEGMYCNLKDRGSSCYREVFTERHELCKERVDELEKHKDSLKGKIETLQKEMEYIEGLLN